MASFIPIILDIPYWGCMVICRWTKWFTSYTYLFFCKRNSRKYEYIMNSDDPLKNGLFIPAGEWDLECASENQDSSEMFCFGVNSSGECLAVQIVRDCVCHSSSYLFLKINGYTYTLPVTHNFYTTNDKKIFGNNRFYMQCLAPFRKWKIFFNGMLREECVEKAHDNIIHVRFSFIWVASSGVFDFISDYSAHNLADILSETKWNSLKPPVKKILSILNEYHQPGMLQGTAHIGNNPKKEIIMWGCRRHGFGTKFKDMENHIELFGHSETGFLFYFKIFKLSGVLKRNTSGYIMLSNGLLKPACILSAKTNTLGSKDILSFKIKTGGLYHDISMCIYEYRYLFARRKDGKLILSVVDTIVNGVWGSGIVIKRIPAHTMSCHKKCKQLTPFLEIKPVSESSTAPLVMTLKNPLCLNRCLSGNFGSTLSKVMQMKDEISGYHMQNCLVITTSGYEEFISPVKNSILILKENASKYGAEELQPLCERIVEEVSNFYFPPFLFDEICDNLNEILEDSESTTFHIYPSVCGGITEALLLEAYLSTYSHVIGLPNIITCIKKCWASQFSFAAIQCKRGTGLSLNLPMAVIVQKTPVFKISGILSTCDVSTGDPSIMVIREKIDEISPGAIHIVNLKRDLKNSLKIENGYIVCISDQKEESNQDCKEEIIAPYDDENSLSKEKLLFIGKVACKLENVFQFSLCIEWCMENKTLCIIQVRPITLMNVETKSEILHYHDTYLRTEDEWCSVYNTGEGFVGAMSPLGMNILNFCIEIFIAKLNYFNSDSWKMSQVPYFPKFLIYSHYHVMYSVADLHGILQCMKLDSFVNTLPYIINFKLEMEPDGELLYELVSHRHGYIYSSFEIIWESIRLFFFRRHKSREEKSRVRFSLEKEINEGQFTSVDSTPDTLINISNQCQDLTEAFVNFMTCTYRAILWSISVFYILQKIRRDKTNTNIYVEFNYLMSSCSKSEEGDITVDILALSNRIAKNIDPLSFKEMPLEDAKIWLEDTEIDKKVQFSDFLHKHGHRCYKEVDIFQKCWSMDPRTVVHALQVIVPFSPHYNFEHTYPSLDNIFNQLSVMPNFFQKLLLKYTVRKCVKAVKEAKKAKSDLLKVFSHWRTTFHHLADELVKDFLIPFPQAMFFLNLDEIRQLIQTESPTLVTKALKCWEIHADVNEYIFPVITVEYPFPLSKNYYADKRLKIGSCLKGCPASRGTVVGTVVVATNFCETLSIQKGSILVTPSPSIVWSLYFSVLGGFATDLGGLLSDGAIAARECEIPCVIGLIRASKVLKTGDRVYLSANKGILERVSPDWTE